MKNSETMLNLLANHEFHQEHPPKSVPELPERSRHDLIVRRMSESFKVVGGGKLVASEVSAAVAPVEEGGGGTSLEDAP